jgi:hypothetical protein
MTDPASRDEVNGRIARAERCVLAVLARRGRRAFKHHLVAAVDELNADELALMLEDLTRRGLVSGPSGSLVEYALTDAGWRALQASRVA